MVGGVHKLRLQKEGGRWSKKSNFCKFLYCRKCKRKGVSGQKKINLVNIVCERLLVQKYLVAKINIFVHCSISECLANQQATVLQLSHSVVVFELNMTIWQDLIESLWFILPGVTFLVSCNQIGSFQNSSLWSWGKDVWHILQSTCVNCTNELYRTLFNTANNWIDVLHYSGDVLN